MQRDTYHSIAYFIKNFQATQLLRQNLNNSVPEKMASLKKRSPPPNKKR